MISDLEDDPRVQMAGMIGRYFRIDPILVLESSYWDWAVRVAALNYAAAQEKKANEKKSTTSDPKMHHL